MQQDGVQHAGPAGESSRAAIALQHDPRVVCQQRAGGQQLAVPLGESSHGFGDDESGAFLAEFGNGSGKHVAEAEANDPQFRLAGRSERGAGETGKFLFRSASGRAADLLAVDDQGLAPVMFLQGERAAVGQHGGGEGDSWFHGAEDLGCHRGLSPRWKLETTKITKRLEKPMACGSQYSRRSVVLPMP